MFDEGYETYEFYNAILSCVRDKIYIYGRKNRKLFTKNNTKIKELLNNNVDFKCLFLSDKSSSSILKIAQENENFENDLKHNNKWTKSNNTYGHLSKGKIPNIFFGHLMVDCNSKEYNNLNNYLF